MSNKKNFIWVSLNLAFLKKLCYGEEEVYSTELEHCKFCSVGEEVVKPRSHEMLNVINFCHYWTVLRRIIQCLLIVMLYSKRNICSAWKCLQKEWNKIKRGVTLRWQRSVNTPRGHLKRWPGPMACRYLIGRGKFFTASLLFAITGKFTNMIWPSFCQTRTIAVEDGWLNEKNIV